MEQSTLNIILTCAYIVSTIIVGFILRTQTKSQTEIINHYKEQVNSFDVKPLAELHKEHIELKTNIHNETLEILQHQNLEMAYYVTQLLDFYEDNLQRGSTEKTRNSIINIAMPSCAKLLADVKSNLTL